jgi:hypothetical protein
MAAGASGTLPYGIIRHVAGAASSFELVLVIVGGAEIFTGNNLRAMALLRDGSQPGRSCATGPSSSPGILSGGRDRGLRNCRWTHRYLATVE